MKIESHKHLAEHIAGKGILHLNSLGKDSAVCLEWLARFATPERIVSVHFQHLASHPDDERYLRYQKARYPKVKFIVEPNGHELNNIAQGMYQSPLEVIEDLNSWDFDEFSMSDQAEELRTKLGLDYICIGNSKYESVARAMKFYKEGLLIKKAIYPLGLMTKADITNIIKASGLKVHPTYKFAKGSFDHPSYYKMRAAFIAKPAYEKSVMATFPLLALDKYRYEKLFKKGKS